MGANTWTGVVKNMKVNSKGEIVHIYVKISGSTSSVCIQGCGAMSAAQPLFNDAFLAKRVVYIDTRAGGCFNAVTVNRPN